MKDKFTIEILREDGLINVKLFKNNDACIFKEILEHENSALIILDLIAQSYDMGYGASYQGAKNMVIGIVKHALGEIQ